MTRQRKKQDSNDVTPENKAIGDVIASARNAAGLTQADVVHRTGISQQSLSHYEVGRRAVTVVDLKKIADAIGVPASALVDPSAPPEMVGRLTEEDVTILALYAHAHPEARSAAKSLLSQPERAARYLARIYWASYEGQKEKSFDVPIREKTPVPPSSPDSEIHG